MSQEDVLALIRLARKYPEESDALLSVAERIGSNGEGRDLHVGRGQTISFPIEVFCNYKGNRHTGMLSGDRTVTVNGTKYNKPSPAAKSITKNNVNGLRWWCYRDPSSGKIRQIKYLEEQGLI